MTQCLRKENNINIDNNKYIINNIDTDFGFYDNSDGYIFKNIPKNHPLSINATTNIENDNYFRYQYYDNEKYVAEIFVSHGNDISYENGDYFIFYDTSHNIINIGNHASISSNNYLSNDIPSDNFYFMAGATYKFTKDICFNNNLIFGISGDSGTDYNNKIIDKSNNHFHLKIPDELSSLNVFYYLQQYGIYTIEASNNITFLYKNNKNFYYGDIKLIINNNFSNISNVTLNFIDYFDELTDNVNLSYNSVCDISINRIYLNKVSTYNENSINYYVTRGSYYIINVPDVKDINYDNDYIKIDENCHYTTNNNILKLDIKSRFTSTIDVKLNEKPIFNIKYDDTNYSKNVYNNYDIDNSNIKLIFLDEYGNEKETNQDGIIEYEISKYHKTGINYMQYKLHDNYNNDISFIVIEQDIRNDDYNKTYFFKNYTLNDYYNIIQLFDNVTIKYNVYQGPYIDISIDNILYNINNNSLINLFINNNNYNSTPINNYNIDSFINDTDSKKIKLPYQIEISGNYYDSSNNNIPIYNKLYTYTDYSYNNYNIYTPYNYKFEKNNIAIQLTSIKKNDLKNIYDKFISFFDKIGDYRIFFRLDINENSINIYDDYDIKSDTLTYTNYLDHISISFEQKVTINDEPDIISSIKLYENYFIYKGIFSSENNVKFYKDNSNILEFSANYIKPLLFTNEIDTSGIPLKFNGQYDIIITTLGLGKNDYIYNSYNYDNSLNNDFYTIKANISHNFPDIKYNINSIYYIDNSNIEIYYYHININDEIYYNNNYTVKNNLLNKISFFNNDNNISYDNILIEKTIEYPYVLDINIEQDTDDIGKWYIQCGLSQNNFNLQTNRLTLTINKNPDDFLPYNINGSKIVKQNMRGINELNNQDISYTDKGFDISGINIDISNIYFTDSSSSNGYININDIDISYSTDLCLNIISDYNLYFDFSYSGKYNNFTRTIQVRDIDPPVIIFNDFSNIPTLSDICYNTENNGENVILYINRNYNDDDISKILHDSSGYTLYDNNTLEEQLKNKFSINNINNIFFDVSYINDISFIIEYNVTDSCGNQTSKNRYISISYDTSVDVSFSYNNIYNNNPYIVTYSNNSDFSFQAANSGNSDALTQLNEIILDYKISDNYFSATKYTDNEDKKNFILYKIYVKNNNTLNDDEIYDEISYNINVDNSTNYIDICRTDLSNIVTKIGYNYTIDYYFTKPFNIGDISFTRNFKIISTLPLDISFNSNYKLSFGDDFSINNTIKDISHNRFQDISINNLNNYMYEISINNITAQNNGYENNNIYENITEDNIKYKPGIFDISLNIINNYDGSSIAKNINVEILDYGPEISFNNNFNDEYEAGNPISDASLISGIICTSDYDRYYYNINHDNSDFSYISTPFFIKSIKNIDDQSELDQSLPKRGTYTAIYTSKDIFNRSNDFSRNIVVLDSKPPFVLDTRQEIILNSSDFLTGNLSNKLELMIRDDGDNITFKIIPLDNPNNYDNNIDKYYAENCSIKLYDNNGIPIDISGSKGNLFLDEVDINNYNNYNPHYIKYTFKDTSNNPGEISINLLIYLDVIGEYSIIVNSNSHNLDESFNEINTDKFNINYTHSSKTIQYQATNQSDFIEGISFDAIYYRDISYNYSENKYELNKDISLNSGSNSITSINHDISSNNIGFYEIYFTFNNIQENFSSIKMFTFQVIDTKPPLLTLNTDIEPNIFTNTIMNGDDFYRPYKLSVMDLENYNDNSNNEYTKFKDPGIHIQDNLDGDFNFNYNTEKYKNAINNFHSYNNSIFKIKYTYKKSNGVDVSLQYMMTICGDYIQIYFVKDKSENESSIIRYINTSRLNPVIILNKTINGYEKIYHTQFFTYRDIGIERIIDSYDINNNIEDYTLDESKLKLNILGDYIVKYNYNNNNDINIYKNRPVCVVNKELINENSIIDICNNKLFIYNNVLDIDIKVLLDNYSKFNKYCFNKNIKIQLDSSNNNYAYNFYNNNDNNNFNVYSDMSINISDIDYYYGRIDISINGDFDRISIRAYDISNEEIINLSNGEDILLYDSSYIQIESLNDDIDSFEDYDNLYKKEFDVKVDSVNKSFTFNGIKQDLYLPFGLYTFNVNNYTNFYNPILFATDPSGIHKNYISSIDINNLNLNYNIIYAKNIIRNNLAGTSGAYIKLLIDANTPSPLFYYNKNFKNMYGAIYITSNITISRDITNNNNNKILTINGNILDISNSLNIDTLDNSNNLIILSSKNKNNNEPFIGITQSNFIKNFTYNFNNKILYIENHKKK